MVVALTHPQRPPSGGCRLFKLPCPSCRSWPRSGSGYRTHAPTATYGRTCAGLGTGRSLGARARVEVPAELGAVPQLVGHLSASTILAPDEPCEPRRAYTPPPPDYQAAGATGSFSFDGPRHGHVSSQISGPRESTGTPTIEI